ncbi:galactoside O-acetyltransferase [Corynebacterium atypicum]|uniref:Galactoside O-acetyltransferase n=1 Tax=Corynebacterium atypicum TaxID=191610 RepID=A0ABN4DAU3_9CORY|nr:sugar O-acetyltransferase [Corynebacterium atypicum]AIG63409.1 galactoside O-acetyltransferase [Corynebacterium atypicum]
MTRNISGFDPDAFSSLERMRSGEWYLCTSEEFAAEQRRSAELVHELNQLGNTDPERARALIQKLTLAEHAEATVFAPAFIEFGAHVSLGPGVFINAGVTILSSAEVKIGARTMLGPNCQLITPTHPTDSVAMRRGGWERAAAIELGEDVWLGAGVTVLPGVTIGSGTTVGANSTVTKSLPENCVAVGTPARVVRRCDPQRAEAETRGLAPGVPIEPLSLFD